MSDSADGENSKIQHLSDEVDRGDWKVKHLNDGTNGDYLNHLNLPLLRVR